MGVPLYKQLESNDCGPACIQMVSGYYGKKYNLKTIKNFCNMTRIGISLKDVVDCCQTIGFKVASVNVNIEETRRMPLPAILYMKHGHFVVLEKIERKKDSYIYYLLDPAYGKVKLTEENFRDRWMVAGRGLGAVMAPLENFHQTEVEDTQVKENHKRILSSFRSVFMKHRRNFIWIGLLTTIVLVANWAMPLLLKKTIDDGIMEKNINVVWMMLFSQFIFFLGFMFSGNISNLLTAKTSFKVNIEFITAYFHKIIKLPMGFFDTGFRSDLIQRISDQSRINSFVTSNITSILFTILNLIVFSVILLIYNYKVFLLFAVFSIVSIIYNSFFLAERRNLDYSLFSNESDRRNSTHELIMGMSEIKINNAQISRISLWKKLEDKINTLRIKGIYLDYYMSNGASLIGRLRDIILTGICAFYVIQDNMTIGAMMMISFVLGQLAAPVNDLISFTKTFQDAKLSYERLLDIYERPDEGNEDKRHLYDLKIKHPVQFRNVSFKYAGTFSPYVLEDVTFDIPVGKKTAIVGSSGSGKTTLLKLLLGFYYPDQGNIRIDGTPIEDIDLDSWRDKCGVVMQDGYIFSGSIAENIALADEEPDRKRLQYAARIARIDQYIEKLPMGYQTPIGEKGIALSGGEKQRIYIARAVYKNPEFIFFDEATSSLDANNEKDIMNNLEEFYRNKTVIIIAHRLSTVKNADNIIYLDDGKIIEQGNHEQLIRLKGAYYQLVKNQLELDN